MRMQEQRTQDALMILEHKKQKIIKEYEIWLQKQDKSQKRAQGLTLHLVSHFNWLLKPKQNKEDELKRMKLLADRIEAVVHCNEYRHEMDKSDFFFRTILFDICRKIYRVKQSHCADQLLLEIMSQ
jgi:hypothetical protein